MTISLNRVEYKKNNGLYMQKLSDIPKNVNFKSEKPVVGEIDSLKDVMKQGSVLGLGMGVALSVGSLIVGALSSPAAIGVALATPIVYAIIGASLALLDPELQKTALSRLSNMRNREVPQVQSPNMGAKQY